MYRVLPCSRLLTFTHYFLHFISGRGFNTQNTPLVTAFLVGAPEIGWWILQWDRRSHDNHRMLELYIAHKLYANTRQMRLKLRKRS